MKLKTFNSHCPAFPPLPGNVETSSCMSLLLAIICIYQYTVYALLLKMDVFLAKNSSNCSYNVYLFCCLRRMYFYQSRICVMVLFSKPNKHLRTFTITQHKNKVFID